MLEDAGVIRIEAITDDYLNVLNDAVRINTNIKWIHVRLEEFRTFTALHHPSGSFSYELGSNDFFSIEVFSLPNY